MPREIYLLTPQEVDLRALVKAGMEIDPDLRVRALFDGNVIQLVHLDESEPAGSAGRAVLSLENARRLDETSDARRIVNVDVPSDAVWWVLGWAPWGRIGERGVAVARELARQLGGIVVVQDGT